MTLYLREHDGVTLKDVADKLDDKCVTVRVSSTEVAMDLVTDRSIAFKTDSGMDVEVPANEGAVQAFSDWLQVPIPFVKRIDDDLRQHLLTTLLERTPGDMLIRYNDEQGVTEIRNPRAKHIEPRRLVEVMGRVITPEAPVVGWYTGGEFALDVIAPEDFDRGIGGDRKVGDLTRGGVRVRQDVKHNLAPTVSQLLWRLACTNGQEIANEAWKIDARGETVEEVLAHFEATADAAFRAAESSINAFYDLRNQAVANPERAIRRIAVEQAIPDRTLVRLLDRAAGEDVPDEASMFDIVNLITNEANNPSISRVGGRHLLQQAGGAVVSDHAARCGHCLSRLN